jgi:hypothetical protein
MNDVLTRPDARPASSGSTSRIAASSSGLKAMPAPRPSRIMLGSTSTANVRSTGARAKSASEAGPDQEQTSVAEEVTQPACQEQEPTEREQVCVRNPGERALREPEILPDRGQRDAHDRHVEEIIRWPRHTMTSASQRFLVVIRSVIVVPPPFVVSTEESERAAGSRRARHR